MLLTRFKWFAFLAAFGLLVGAASAQTTTVSITAVDLGGQVWANGTISYVFQPNPSYGGIYQWNGAALPSQYLTPKIVTLNGSGAASFTTPTSTAISPAGSSWKYVVCPNASSSCTVVNIVSTGSTQNISSTITANSPSLHIQAGPMPLAYSDTEILVTPNQGGIYFNVTSFLPKYFDGSNWQFYGGGGGGGVTFINGVAGSFTFTGSGVSCTSTTCTFSGGGGGGTVTSVGLSVPSIFSVSGSPVTTNGTLAISLSNAAANTIFANPTNSSATPVFTTNPVVTTITSGTFLYDSTGVNTHGGDFGFNISTANLYLATAGNGTIVQIQTGNTFELGALSGCLSADAVTHIVIGNGSACGGGGGTGTVTSFSAGTLSPLFTTSVATATTTPALSFTLSTQVANSVFGNFTGSTAAPTFSNAPVFSAAGLTNIPACGTCIVTGTAAGGGLSGTYTNPTIAGLGPQYYFSASNGSNIFATTNIFTDATGNNLTNLSGKASFRYFWSNPDGVNPIDSTGDVFIANAVYKWTWLELQNITCGTSGSFPGAAFLAGTGNTENTLIMGHLSPCLSGAQVPPDDNYIMGTGAIHQAYGTSIATITNISLTSNVVTITAANSYSIGQYVQPTGLGGASFLNFQTGLILSASSTQFTYAFTHANYSSTPDSGIATIVTDNVIQIGMEGHGTVNIGGSIQTPDISFRAGIVPNGIFLPSLTNLACLGTDTNGKIGLGSCGGGSGTVTSIATTGPIGGGTITTTGTITCTTCVTSTASLSSNFLVLGAGSQASKTVAGITTDGVSIITLGVAGTSAGGIVFNNATSGSITISPPTGALGTITQTLQAASGQISVTIARGTSALGTGAISSGTCATAVTTTATGTLTTDPIGWGFNGDPIAVTGYTPTATGMLTIIAYPSSGNVNFKVCNNTSSSITPGAITLNWTVIR